MFYVLIVKHNSIVVNINSYNKFHLNFKFMQKVSNSAYNRSFQFFQFSKKPMKVWESL